MTNDKLQITNRGAGLRIAALMSRVAFITVLAVVLAMVVVPGVAFASDDIRETPRFTDETGILTDNQVAELNAKFDEISRRQQFDVVGNITYSLDGKPSRLYAADFFEDQGFGYGQERDGIILMIAMEYRDFAFVTTGYGLYAFTNAGQEYMEKLFIGHLGNNEFFEAFVVFAETADDFVSRARAGERYDSGNIPLTPQERSTYRIVALVISLIIAFAVPGIIVGVRTRQLKSVRKKDFASDYVRQGSMALNVQRDIFLYRNISRTRRAENNNSGGGSSGSFRSSSGSSFSGRSGRF